MNLRMDRTQIEQLVADRVRAAAEKAIVAAVDELNAAGHRFEADGETLIDWREPGSARKLSVLCTVGVNYAETGVSKSTPDPEIESFMARAQSGRDRTAALLNHLEGGVSNGGLFQTIENRGIGFLEECSAALKAIGAKATARIVDRAVGEWHEHQAALEGYADLRRRLGKLDRRFWALEESIAVLYARARSKA